MACRTHSTRMTTTTACPIGGRSCTGSTPFDPSDADDDPDGDGLDNLAEFMAGTDPNVPNALFRDGFESGNTSAWSNVVP